MCKAYQQALSEVAYIKEKLQRVSHLDEVALGEDKKKTGAWNKKDELEEKADECEKQQKDFFLAEHVTTCDQQGLDYDTAWFVCTLDNLRKLLVQVWFAQFTINFIRFNSQFFPFRTAGIWEGLSLWSLLFLLQMLTHAYLKCSITIDFAAKAGKIAWTSDECCMQQKGIVPSQRSLSCELQYDYLCSK